MTKREIENLVIQYANKAHYNADMGNREIRDRIETAVRDIIALSYLLPSQGRNFRFGKNQKITLVFAGLKKDITEIIRKRTDAAKKVSSLMNKRLEIDPVDWDSNGWIDSVRFGKSFSTSLDEHTQRLKSELEFYIAIAQDKSLTQSEAVSLFLTNINNPTVSNEAIAAAGFSAAVAGKLFKVQVGGIKSGVKLIDRLSEDMLISGYHISNGKSWGAKGLFKYIVTRGDSLVCSVCADNAMRTFKADEFVVPAHNRCRCIEVPILV